MVLEEEEKRLVWIRNKEILTSTGCGKSLNGYTDFNQTEINRMTQQFLNMVTWRGSFREVQAPLLTSLYNDPMDPGQNTPRSPLTRTSNRLLYALNTLFPDLDSLLINLHTPKIKYVKSASTRGSTQFTAASINRPTRNTKRPNFLEIACWPLPSYPKDNADEHENCLP